MRRFWLILTLCGASFLALHFQLSSNTSDSDLLDHLAQTTAQSPSKEAMDSAVENWSECVDEQTSDFFQCASWEADGIKFVSLGIVKDDWVTPFVKSSFLRVAPDDKRVVLHLSGGTDLYPVSSLPDNRIAGYQAFYEAGYQVYSIGYWGTAFRTTLETQEIELAERDFFTAYEYLHENCDCEPLIVVESLGAGILFHHMKKRALAKYKFLAISPVLDGIEHAAEYYDSESSRRTNRFALAKSSYYTQSGDIYFDYVGWRIVNTTNHLKAFSEGIDSSITGISDTHSCSRVLVGGDDPLNQEKSKQYPAFILRINGAGHALFDEAPLAVSGAVENFLRCANTRG